jgi:hypothetical protein
MARVVDRVYGKLDYYEQVNEVDATRAPIVDAYIISWLYGEDSIGEVNASNTYAKLNASGYYDKLKLKTKAAGDSIKAINPKAFEKEVENYVKVENSLNKEKKITTVEEGCIFSYKAPNVVTSMSIGVITVPYNITIKYSAKKIEELFYTENVVKEIENALIKIYASNINPEIVKFDVIVKSGSTGYDITFIADIKESTGLPYTGIKILGGKTPNQTTGVDLENKIKSSQNYDKGDMITVVSIPISQFGINYYYAKYTKLKLYPELE